MLGFFVSGEGTIIQGHLKAGSHQMKRSKGVAKRVLEAVRDLDTSDGASLLHVLLRCEKAGDTNDEVHSSISLLKESGYLNEKIHILKLTWGGHDLLETLEAEFLEEMRAALNRR
ncbi:hypothetical protein K0P33_27710 [Pseudomonas sp. ArH3a]|uniref:hypothetical protein n=1 Tax=Pseudomonas sp. ArH3a TaxID=2862945 RepID=UPI001F5636FC|nr:hypothetical protein [Pseudomonas sp. ArH3a]UNM19248.1 hypothetical protein K0P33_27710 [Pseudomonas sp. ArH3a]